LAREALLVCGQYAVDWDYIQKSTAALFVCIDAIDELTEATALSNPEVGSAFEGFTRGMSRLKLFRLLRFYMDRKQSSNENAYALLGVAQNSLSSNPRDKIYGMRGLAEELCWNSQFATIPVDYKISVCDLFMRTAQALYSVTGEVSFLDEIERTTIKGGKRNFDLPSWAPDWTLPTSYGQPLRDSVRNSINRRLPKDNRVFSTTCRGKAVCSFDLTSKKSPSKDLWWTQYDSWKLALSIYHLLFVCKMQSDLYHDYVGNCRQNRICKRDIYTGPHSLDHNSRQSSG
jgi:hypothetical protein